MSRHPCRRAETRRQDADNGFMVRGGNRAGEIYYAGGVRERPQPAASSESTSSRHVRGTVAEVT